MNKILSILVGSFLFFCTDSIAMIQKTATDQSAISGRLTNCGRKVKKTNLHKIEEEGSTSTTAHSSTVDPISQPVIRSKSFFTAHQIIYAYAARKGDEQRMEDLIMLRAPKRQNSPFENMTIGLFDGTGGSRAALYALKNLDRYISRGLRSQNSKVNAVYKKSFEDVDREIVMHKNTMAKQSTTALLAHIYGSCARFSWVGNSRAIVIRDGRTVFSTTDHTVSNSVEKMSVEKKGGVVITNSQLIPSVQGVSCVSRMLGNSVIRKYLNAAPDVEECNLEDGDIVLVASQGLWQTLSNDAVASKVKELDEYSLDELESAYSKQPLLRSRTIEKSVYQETSDNKLHYISRALRDDAYLEGSDKNISLLMVRIQLESTDFTDSSE